MIIKEYFIPLDKKAIPETFFDDSWIHKVQIHTAKQFPEPEEPSLIMIGITGQEQSSFLTFVRKILYGYSQNEMATRFYDLGNYLLSPEDERNVEKLGFILSELKDKGHTVILLSSTPEIMYSQYLAFDYLKKIINISLVDSTIDFQWKNNSKSYLNKILLKDPSYLFNLSILGYQSYMTSDKTIEFLDNYFFDILRLGIVREDLSQVEPVFRGSDIVGIHLKSCRAADVPGVQNTSPNGFTAEEMCRLSRYAGLSDFTSSFSIIGWPEKGPDNPVLAQLIAQMIWFFADGYRFRDMEILHRSENNFIKYITTSHHNEYEIVFYKSKKTQRWWMEIPLENGEEKFKRKQLLPCSYKDYQEALKGEIPDRWFRAIKKL